MYCILTFPSPIDLINTNKYFISLQKILQTTFLIVLSISAKTLFSYNITKKLKYNNCLSV